MLRLYYNLEKMQDCICDKQSAIMANVDKIKHVEV